MKNNKTLYKYILLNNKEIPIYIIYKDYQKYIYCRFKKDHFEITSYKKIKIKEEDIDKLCLNLYKKLEKSNYFNKNEINKDVIYILGNPYKIINNSIYINERYLNLTYLDKYIEKEIYPLIIEEFNRYRELMNVPNIYKLSFRKMSTRLGSNSKKTKKITLSKSLISYSLEIIDSVIVHELAHYYVFNHSTSFYDIVYKYYPNYKEARKKLIKGIYQ